MLNWVYSHKKETNTNCTIPFNYLKGIFYFHTGNCPISFNSPPIFSQPYV